MHVEQPRFEATEILFASLTTFTGFGQRNLENRPGSVLRISVSAVLLGGIHDCFHQMTNINGTELNLCAY